jgi:hypothetical protein
MKRTPLAGGDGGVGWALTERKRRERKEAAPAWGFEEEPEYL